MRVLLVTIFLVVYVSCFNYDGVNYGLQSSETSSATCDGVNITPRPQQCSYVKEHCLGSENAIGWFSYISMYYCGSSSFALLKMAILLVLFFFSLGFTASEHLCPNLYTISKFLKLSDNLAGLTLLALGNGAPDVLSTYQGMSLDSSGLAISELIGASMFVCTVVIGFTAIIEPYKVPEIPFFRDLSFLFVVVLALFVTLLTGSLGIVTYVALVVLYACYVSSVILFHSVLRKRAKERLRNKRLRSVYASDQTFDRVEGEDDIYLDSFEELPTIDQLRFHINGENMHVINPGDDETDGEQIANVLGQNDIPAGSYGLQALFRELRKHTHMHPKIQINTSPLTDSVDMTHFSASDAIHSSRPRGLMANALDDDDDDDDSEYEDEVEHLRSVFHDRDGIISSCDIEKSLYVKFLFPQLTNFHDLNLSNKVLSLVCIPVAFLLRLTTPVRDFSTLELLQKKQGSSIIRLSNNEDNISFDFEEDKMLLMIQGFFSTNFVSYIMFGGLHQFPYMIFPLTVILSLAVAHSVKVLYDPSMSSSRSIMNIKLIHNLSALLGFVSAITWISVFATEVISILKTASVIFDLHEDVLGMTIFALGNSLGDLISNVIIAKMGMPLMALGACFGGPFLGICSIGFSGLVLMIKGDYSGCKVNLSATMLIGLCTLLFNFLFLLYAVPKNGWILGKGIGVLLVTNWLIGIIVCILTELL